MWGYHPISEIEMSNTALPSVAVSADNPATALPNTGVGDKQPVVAFIVNSGILPVSLVSSAGTAAGNIVIPAGRSARCGPFTGESLPTNGLFATGPNACSVQYVRHTPFIGTDGSLGDRVQRGGEDDTFFFELTDLGSAEWSASLGAEVADVIELTLQTADGLPGQFDILVGSNNGLPDPSMYTTTVAIGTALYGDASAMGVFDTDASGTLVLYVTDIVGASAASAFVRVTRVDRWSMGVVEVAFDGV